MSTLDGKRVLIFVGDDYEDLELWYPKLRLTEAGADVTVAGAKANHVYHGKHSYPCESDASYAEVRSGDFDALVIPGGWMPDKLRRDETVLQLTRSFSEQGKVVAAICHGGWILASADVCKGRTLTSTPAIKDDLRNAGAEWVDRETVVDGKFVSARRPPDLPAFCSAIIEVMGG